MLSVWCSMNIERISHNLIHVLPVFLKAYAHHSTDYTCKSWTTNITEYCTQGFQYRSFCCAGWHWYFENHSSFLVCWCSPAGTANPHYGIFNVRVYCHVFLSTEMQSIQNWVKTVIHKKNCIWVAYNMKQLQKPLMHSASSHVENSHFLLSLLEGF